MHRANKVWILVSGLGCRVQSREQTLIFTPESVCGNSVPAWCDLPHMRLLSRLDTCANAVQNSTGCLWHTRSYSMLPTGVPVTRAISPDMLAIHSQPLPVTPPFPTHLMGQALSSRFATVFGQGMTACSTMQTFRMRRSLVLFTRLCSRHAMHRVLEIKELLLELPAETFLQRPAFSIASSHVTPILQSLLP